MTPEQLRECIALGAETVADAREMFDNMKDYIYIPCNKHAEVRKEWYDKGKPPLEISYDDGWYWYDMDETSIDLSDENITVRIKATE